MTYKIAHEIHPNNETRVTLYKSRGVFLSLKERAASVLGVSTEEVVELTRSVPAPVPKLDIRSDFKTATSDHRTNSHKRTAFGLYAKRRIFRAGGAMDRFDSERSHYLFLTATLPGDTDEAKYGIAEYAHEIINGLKAWLSKRLSNRLEFYVWENQARGALHFHYCIYCPDEAVKENIEKNFKRQMVRLYDGIKRKHDIDLWGKWSNKSARYRTAILQARVEVVYGSVAAYMAGYLAGKTEKHGADRNHRYYPKRWYGISRPLSALIESYTEKVEHEFSSLKEANEYYYTIKDEILDDALDSTEYPHKIGEGRTIAVYHTQEKQLELWQARKMLTHSKQHHPNISSYVSLALRTTLLLRAVLANSKSLRESLPLKFVLYFQDATLVTSMRSGALSQKTIRMLEGVFCAYDFSSSSAYRIQELFPNLKAFTLFTAKYHPEMRFSKEGWLSNNADFNYSVDELAKACYVRTNTDEVDTPNALDGSSGHVPGELSASSYEQLTL